MIELFGSSYRWISSVKHITTDKKHLSVFSFQNLQESIQEVLMLFIAIVLVECLS